MSTEEKPRNTELQVLLDSGVDLKKRILSFLSRWPQDAEGSPITFFNGTPEAYQGEARILELETHRWFNHINQQVLPLVLYDKELLLAEMKKTLSGIEKRSPFGSMYIEPYGAQGQVADAMEAVIRLIQSVPDVPATISPSAQPQLTYQPNTAFILMWMDRSKPELEDVTNAFKEIFGQFGIRALRADDVEHQDKITDVVLEHIRGAEFLIADLTGERPNVYYEVGYAHAIGKRPILYRRKGTPLHFDLSVHNVPEYENITTLKELLQKRLEALTGKNPK